MLPFSTTHTVVPYLHILLGVVKKHHELLDEIVKQIAADMAHLGTESSSSHYNCYIRGLRKLEHLEEKKRLQETKLVFLEESLSVWQYYRKTRHLEERMEKLEVKIDRLKEITKQYVTRCGPVCRSLDTVLKTNKISTQAYHGRSFTGNHCQQYIQPSINKTICSWILSQTKNYTQQQKIIDYAEQVQKTFYQANTLFFNIHKAISHSRPIDKNKVDTIQKMIDGYMNFYRNNASKNVFPKLHFLEHHCTQWISRWGFGMGLHGEQGVELMHSSIKKLENQAQGTRLAEDRLKVIMKSHLTQVSPTLHCLLPGAVKRKEKKKTVKMKVTIRTRARMIVIFVLGREL